MYEEEMFQIKEFFFYFNFKASSLRLLDTIFSIIWGNFGISTTSNVLRVVMKDDELHGLTTFSFVYV